MSGVYEPDGGEVIDGENAFDNHVQKRDVPTLQIIHILQMT
ncbi:MAG: hypothetical protein ACLT2Z_08595 [Eubacterium sp.]